MSFPDKHHKVAVQVPFFHIYALKASISAGLHFGTTMVLPAAFHQPDKTLDIIIKEGYFQRIKENSICN